MRAKTIIGWASLVWLAAHADAGDERREALRREFFALMEQAMPAVAGTCDGWPLMREAAEIQERFEQDIDQQQRVLRGDGDAIGFLPESLFSPGPTWEHVEIARLVFDNWRSFEATCTFEVVDRAVQCGHWVPRWDEHGADSILMPAVVGPLRRLTISQAARLWFATLRNDDDGAIRAWRACEALRAASDAVPSLIGLLIRNSLVSAHRRAALASLDHYPGDDVLRVMSEPCEWLEPEGRKSSISRALRGERLAWKTMIGAVYDEKGRLKLDTLNLICTMDASLLFMSDLEEVDPPRDPVREAWLELLTDERIRFASPFFASLAEADMAIDDYYDLIIAELAGSDTEQARALERLKTYREGLGPRHVAAGYMLEMFEKAWVKCARMSHEVIGLRHSLRVILLIERFERRHGRYPDRLDELVPEFLSTVPVDRFNSKAFGYHRRAPHRGAEGQRPYVLYSFGPDGIDNGGRNPAFSSRASQLMYLTPAGEDFIYSD